MTDNFDPNTLKEAYQEKLEKLVLELIKLPKETEWVEFKQNYSEPELIGEYISALSNSAAIHKKSSAFIVWGIEDETHQIVGTTFKPSKAKLKNQELENWLLTQLKPQIEFQMYEGLVEGKEISLFEIQPARYNPISFKNEEYIRIGSHKKKLKKYPEKERTLWRIFEQIRFENEIAISDVSSEQILSLIDYPACFQLLDYPLPENRTAILERLEQEKIISKKGSNTYNISNIGAILFAKELKKFERLARKALRIIIYEGKNRIRTKKEIESEKGYAVEFKSLVRYINEQLPQNEQIKTALRETVRMYPEIAIRELIANALIHQDFTISGAGPMVEIFEDRIEISNPGLPLIDTLRFIDEPPQSRNEGIGALMRRVGICEERGSGIDKVIDAVEKYQLPPPDFRKKEQSTMTVLFAPKEFAKMDKEERIRACYQHTCLLYLSNERMRNASFRKRLGLEDKKYTLVSRIIKDAVQSKLIKPYNFDTGKKNSTYIPFWA